MESTSASLLRRLQSPDAAIAWGRFVDLYAPLIYHWGRGHGLSATDSADLVQEVMAILVVKLPEFQYDPSRRFRGWLRTVAINKANDFHRVARNRPTADAPIVQETAAVASDVDLLAEKEYRKFLINRSLQVMQSELRDSDWMAVKRHLIDGEKASEVAKSLGISTNRVYLAKSRILKRLRDELAGLMD